MTNLNNKDELFEKQLEEIKYRFGYKINESPKYHQLVNDNDEYDELPMTNEAGDQEDAPKPGGGEVPPAPSNDLPIDAAPPVPEFDKDSDKSDVVKPNIGEVPPTTEPNIPEEESVDEIQNDIIKSNIEAMKSIHDKLENLDNLTQSLNSKLDALNNDVEEVREPSNSEKLMSKKNISYPYYLNLNDMWTGNWFDQQREQEVSRGIKKMPDGSFIADFDDLPLESKIDIQDSFNDTL